MSPRICPEIDDHEWVSDGPYGECHCQACGLTLEDAIEAHSMQEMTEDDLEHDHKWRGPPQDS